MQGIADARRGLASDLAAVTRARVEQLGMMQKALDHAISTGQDCLYQTGRRYMSDLETELADLHDYLGRLLGCTDRNELANQIIERTADELARMLHVGLYDGSLAVAPREAAQPRRPPAVHHQVTGTCLVPECAAQGITHGLDAVTLNLANDVSCET